MIAAAQHYTDEQLLELPPDHPHLTDCTSCSAALSAIHDLAATLTNDLTWDAEPVSELPNLATVATLRTIATQMDAEDADAERNVAAVLSMPRESWFSTLAARPEYRTPGFVRRLIAETDRLIDSRPADVVEITALGQPRFVRMARRYGSAFARSGVERARVRVVLRGQTCGSARGGGSGGGAFGAGRDRGV